MKSITCIAILFSALGLVQAQSTSLTDVAARNQITQLPGVCSAGVQYYLTVATSTNPIGTYTCNKDNTTYSVAGANLRDFISIKDYGAVGDTREVSDAVTSSSSTTVACHVILWYSLLGRKYEHHT